jgi:hypothetical protein
LATRGILRAQPPVAKPASASTAVNLDDERQDRAAMFPNSLLGSRSLSPRI